MAKGNKQKQVMQIGDFAQRAGVSVRAIRYYEEMGLLRPKAHSGGGFRLYGSENLKRVQIINFLKGIGLSLSEIRRILLAKQSSGADRETVVFLLKIFADEVKLVDEKLEMLNRMKGELSRTLKILRSCENCSRGVLLDAIQCSDCELLASRESVPDTFEVILQ
jgi:MerR family copper efflux transcriptional regulator